MLIFRHLSMSDLCTCAQVQYCATIELFMYGRDGR